MTGSRGQPAALGHALEPDYTDGSPDIRLRTIGVDIGSSTSMFTVSDVRLALVGSRFVPVHRDVVVASDILLTPYAASGLIDGDALVRFFQEQLRRGQVDVAEIDSGAVILTGNALERENSRLVGDVFAEIAGKFVVTSAGDELEALLSAFGSGAVEASRARAEPLVHVDIGGGTTKFALCVEGRVVRTTAIRVGARVIAVDDGGRLIHATPTGLALLRRLDVDAAVGIVLPPEVRNRLAAMVVDRVFDVLESPYSAELRELLLGPPLAPPSRFALSFGGGVSEYVYEREHRSFGDLGQAVGELVRDRLRRRSLALVGLPKGIRSTVTGASQYTVQVTSQTVDVSSDALLPLRNAPVVVLDVAALGEAFDSEAVADQLRPFVAGLRLHQARTVGVALLWSGSASYGRLEKIARGVGEAMSPTWTERALALVVSDADIGGLLGSALRRHLAPGTALVCVDGIECRAFDFVDIGELDQAARVFPVVVKSLLFPTAGDRGGTLSSAPRAKQRTPSA